MLKPNDSKALMLVNRPQKQHGDSVNNMSSTSLNNFVLLEADTLFSLHLQEPCCFIANTIENKPNPISIPEYNLYYMRNFCHLIIKSHATSTAGKLKS